MDAGQAFGIAAGQPAAVAGLAGPCAPDGLRRVIAPNGELLAVVEAQGGAWQLRRVVMADAADLYRPGTGC